MIGTAGNFVGPKCCGIGGGVAGPIETLQDEDPLLIEENESLGLLCTNPSDSDRWVWKYPIDSAVGKYPSVTYSFGDGKGLLKSTCCGCIGAGCGW